MFKTICAITLMRKGSKRLPNKCMLKIDNKELYKYTVDFAIELGYPYYLAHDYDNLSLDKRVIEIKRKENYTGSIHKTCEEILSFNLNYDIYILLQITNPMRNLAVLKNSIKHFIDNNIMSGISAIKLNKFVYKQNIFNNSSFFKEINFNKFDRDDNGCKKESLYIETGNFYIFKKEMLNKKHITHTNNFYIYEDTHLVDIDNQDDLIQFKKIMGSSF